MRTGSLSPHAPRFGSSTPCFAAVIPSSTKQCRCQRAPCGRRERRPRIVQQSRRGGVAAILRQRKLFLRIESLYRTLHQTRDTDGLQMPA